MRSTTCPCGATFEGADIDALVSQMKAHLDEAHPRWGVTATGARNYLEAEDRLTGGTERQDDIGAIEIHEATPGRIPDVLSFFDHAGFAGNPAWAACYCVFYQNGGQDNPDWSDAKWRDNRAELEERLRKGTTTAVLAYAGRKLAAWCNASPRTEFPSLRGRDEHPDDQVGSIVCFVVAPPYRRHGLGSKLLAAACDSFAARGFKVAEAIPAEGDPERRRRLPRPPPPV